MQVNFTSPYVRYDLFKEYQTHFLESFQKKDKTQLHEFERSQKLIIYEYLFYQECKFWDKVFMLNLDDFLSIANVNDGLITNPIEVHSYLLIQRFKNSVKQFKNTEFKATFLERKEIYFKAKKYEIPHYKKFLNIYFWHFNKINCLNGYYIKLENEVTNRIDSFTDSNYQNI